MSRGGWVMIIGGVLLLVGIGLFAFGIASLGLNPVSTTLPPGAFENRTVNVQEAGSFVVYLVQIQNFMTGDELTVTLQAPSGEVRRATVTSADPLIPEPYITTEQGVHSVVIQNTGAAQSVRFLLSANVINLTVVTFLAIGPLIGIAGFVVLIIGLILWLIDRRRRPTPPMEMPPPPS